MRVSIAVLGLCFALGACSDEPGWRDASGRGRSPSLAAADQDACFRSEAKSLPKDPTDAQMQKVVDRVKACMNSHGWEFSG